MGTPVTSTTKPRRSLGLEGIKLLMSTSAMAATIGLWSVFANRDRLINLSTQPVADSSVSTSEIMLNLPPIPTLVPFEGNTPLPTSQPSLLTVEGLRSVSAPSQPVANNPLAPRVVQGGGGSSGGGGGGGGATTTTRSS
jgi:hypothetical protein